MYSGHSVIECLSTWGGGDIYFIVVACMDKLL